MGFQVSPGINVSEIDLTTIVPAVSTTVGGIAGEFLWGPLNERTLVGSEDDLVARFWKPHTNIAEDWFTAANFLAYSDALWVVRIADETTGGNNTYNATSEATLGSNTAGTGFLVKNDLHYTETYADGSLNVGEWIAKYPGTLGNSLKVSMCASANAYQSTLSGTLAVTAGATTVTGTSTDFQGELSIGDLIQLNGQEVKVSAIASDVSLTISTAHVDGAAANASVVRNWEYFKKVDKVAPGTSTDATRVGALSDEMHVVVVDEDGVISGTADTVLEVYANVSKASDAKKTDGTNNYYVEVVNQLSQWIRWADHAGTVTSAGTVLTNGLTYGVPAKPRTFSLTGGRRGGAPDNADYIRGYNLFKSPEDVDISFLLASDANGTKGDHLIDNIAESRKDILVCFSPEKADVVNNSGSESTATIAFRDTFNSTSYAVMDCNWKYQYDKYNDLYRWVPLNGDIAGLMVQTDVTRDPWWSPAGYNRGKIKNVTKLAWNPKKAERDLLYKAGVNPVITEPGQGTLLFGDKTMFATPSAFDRINVRRLFIVLEKAISTASKFTLFEFNDEFTRAQFKNLIEPFLRDVQGRRGLTDFRVVCDDTNNTGEVIDRNEFIGDIYIKPARSINFIQLNFVAVRTGVEFDEVVGKF
tara:strand:+ start:5642 stop:7570 length:1929 start_codon:yes stop_codon:yes gene_type:complete